MSQSITVNGAEYLPGFLDAAAQAALVGCAREVARTAPMFHPETRWGKQMSVQMTSAGRFGWYSDRGGYRYEANHPSGAPWPGIPPEVLAVWEDLVSQKRAPDCCLINYYGDGAKMGLHQDRDEADFGWPVLSISLGDDALFRIGGTDRKDPTKSLWLSSGDVLLLKGESRLAFHGIDRIKFGSSGLLKGGGRVNITLRVVR